MSFFSFSRAISHFCSVFRGHLWKRRNFIHITQQSWNVSAGRAPGTAPVGTGLGAKEQISGIAGKADRRSYRFEGSVRISKRLFILLRSFFLSVGETQTLTRRRASVLADRNTAHCQQWKHEPILKKLVRIKDLSSNPKYIQSINSTCFKTIRSKNKTKTSENLRIRILLTPHTKIFS